MATHKVRVQVRFDDVLDLQSLCFRFLDVLINVSLRIDNGSYALRTNQVRGMRQTAQIELFEVHDFRGNLWHGLYRHVPLTAFNPSCYFV